MYVSLPIKKKIRWENRQVIKVNMNKLTYMYEYQFQICGLIVSLLPRRLLFHWSTQFGQFDNFHSSMCNFIYMWLPSFPLPWLDIFYKFVKDIINIKRFSIIFFICHNSIVVKSSSIFLWIVTTLALF